MNLLYQLANEYVNFEIEGKKVRIPYAIVSYAIKKYGVGDDIHAATTGKFENYAGKGTPKQIREVLLSAARKEKFNVSKATSEEIYTFMESHGIGIDCSGFVYNILNGYLRKEKHKSLDTIILRYSGMLGKIERFVLKTNRVRRSNANTLTSNLNTVKIEKVKDMKPGDLIRLTHSDWKGKHIAIIVNVNKNYVVYAMTSEYTKTKGSRFGKIKIIDPNKGLEVQRWEEVNKNGKNYGKDAFDPKRGDSVRRLKFLVGL